MIRIITVFSLCLLFAYSCSAPGSDSGGVQETSDYEDLLTLSREFREYLIPNVVNGVPDYTPAAMRDQFSGLMSFRGRLNAINISTWPVSQQVDYHIVRAEMNGFEFDHRVRKPWSRDPAFYLQSQGGAGPTRYGALRTSDFPVSEAELPDFTMKLKAVPVIFEQAKANLSEASGDLAAFAIHFLENDIGIYKNIVNGVTQHHPEFVPDAERAVAAIEEYDTWLEENLSSMTEPAGLGKENYNWWMKNVQLVPYTWDELMTIMEHEYNRALATLKLEQFRNRSLPEIDPTPTEEAYFARYYYYQRHLLDFLENNEMFTIPDYLKPVPPKAWVNFEGRQGGTVRDFFEEAEDRNPLPSPLVHEFLGHNFDGLRARRDTRPIRGGRRLYAMDMIRSEGVSYALEEIFMHSGLLDKYPQGREINYIMMAFRSVRAIADLKLHSNEFNLEESFEYCYESTPYNWMLPDGFEVWYEMETTLRHPGWHMGMVLGKIQLLKIIADRGSQLGDDFVLQDLMDGFFGAGMIPIALTRWELTGLSDEMEKLLE